ncbi:MAG: hypothetical protein K2Y29_16445 [Beijerinckiaceae bacterium]|nr:hypothetical protein [Beijerinckiaceae bacterium]
MTINTRRLRASLPAVAGEQTPAADRSEKSYVLWLLVFMPVAFIFAIHFVSEILAKG